MSHLIEVVPWTEPRYRSGLERCFPTWGREDFSRWYLARDVGEGAPELFACVSPSGEIEAGVAISYRRLRPGTPGRPEGLCGVITGAWTLPEARRKGLFRKLVGNVALRTQGRGGAWLLGFVTADNTSTRVMVSAGAALYPTWYCSRSAEGSYARRERGRASTSDLTLEDPMEWMDQGPPPATTFAYRVDGWRSQFCRRPDPVELFTVGSGRALVERSATTDRLLAVQPRSVERDAIHVLAERSRAEARDFFCFVTSPDRRDWAVEAGLDAREGYLTVLDLSSTEGPVGVPPSDLGPWSLFAGDRV
ncbi:MAG: hypothetical protein K8J08_10650 [Thermoanaerobaculia bacterium]|nr:hypothetical protein [Thermoanaerobaculia bacterium]